MIRRMLCASRRALEVPASALVLWVMLFSIGSTASAAEPAGALEDEAVVLLREYLRIDTVNPPGNEIRAAEFFRHVLERAGIPSQVFESAPGRGNIVARLKGDGSRPALVLLNHMDVVPVDRRYWTVDPFAAEVKDGSIYGRGAVDMKSMGILQLAILLDLKRRGVPLKSDVIFLGTADEEAGGQMGAGYMVREHFDQLRGAGAVITEFGWIPLDAEGRPQYYAVYTAEKTPLWLRLTAKGTPGHGSTPRGDSAVVKLIEALHRIAQHRTPLRVEPRVQRFYADIAEFDADAAQRAGLRNLSEALRDPVFTESFLKDRIKNSVVRDTISITMLEGSNKVNVIPAQATAQIDVRLLPGSDPALFIEELKRVVADDSIGIETILSFPPSASPTDSPLVEAIRSAAATFSPGVKVVHGMLSGFTDCHFFREKSIPCYGFTPLEVRPGDLGGVHGNDEHVPLSSFRKGISILRHIVQHWAVD